VKSEYIKEEKEDREVAFTRAKKSLDETRKSLPIYAYRQGLLDAIRDNQIIVIEGETGNSLFLLLLLLLFLIKYKDIRN
jgi:HrpA-like RNA helicase